MAPGPLKCGHCEQGTSLIEELEGVNKSEHVRKHLAHSEGYLHIGFRFLISSSVETFKVGMFISI